MLHGANANVEGIFPARLSRLREMEGPAAGTRKPRRGRGFRRCVQGRSEAQPLAFSAIALVSGAAFADPIADRKALMKERGGLVGQLAPIAKGEKPFDAAAVLAALQGLAANGDKFNVEALFPAGSDKGDTKASPDIWTNLGDFQKLDNDTINAANKLEASAKGGDMKAVAADFGDLGKTCGACHNKYRLK